MILLIAISCILMYMQAKKLSVKEIDARIGLKIALISDLHFETALVKQEKIVKEIKKIKPEIVVITGDLCNKIKYISRVEAFLKKMSKAISCPILITLGNHDNLLFTNSGVSKAEYIKNLENISSNIHVLENKIYIYKGVLFGGLGDIKTNNKNCGELTQKWYFKAKELNNKFVILTHNPDMAIKINKNFAPDIILAGHTHGGQMKFPFNIEFTLLKKDILPKKKIYYGKHIYEGKKMYITSGIGCSALPFRFRSTAEIAIIV